MLVKSHHLLRSFGTPSVPPTRMRARMASLAFRKDLMGHGNHSIHRPCQGLEDCPFPLKMGYFQGPTVNLPGSTKKIVFSYHTGLSLSKNFGNSIWDEIC